MKYLVAQSANLRFQWELDVLFTNLFNLDPDAEVVCLYAASGPEANQVCDHTIEKWGDRVDVHMYADMRDDKTYSATFRPYLWYCYLKEDPAREKEQYFQIESDIIFRELPDYSKIRLGPKDWYGSDCGGYIDYNYLKSVQKGDEIVDNFARIIGVDRSVIEKSDGVGAHWMLDSPTAEYWLDVYHNCNKLYWYLEGVNSNIQKWTAEMWAQLYTAYKYGVTQRISDELAFCMATDDVAMWDIRKIYHNNGVTGENSSFLFSKNQWITQTPFGHDFSYVYRSKCSIKYVGALQDVNV